MPNFNVLRHNCLNVGIYSLLYSCSPWLTLTLLGSLWLSLGSLLHILAHSDSAWLTLALSGAHGLPRSLLGSPCRCRVDKVYPALIQHHPFISSFFVVFILLLAIPSHRRQLARHALSIRLIIQLVLWDTSLATTTSMILIVCEDKIRLARHLLDTRSLVTRLWSWSGIGGLAEQDHNRT